MVTYTVVASSILVALFGVLVVSRTTSGLLHARTVSAEDQIRGGQNYAQQYLNQLGQHDESSARQTIQQIANNLASPNGQGGPVPAAVLYPPDALGAAGVTPGVSSTATLPQLTVALAGLRPVVEANHLAHQFVSCNVGGTGMRPCLAVGIPVSSVRAGTFQLFYLYPLDTEQTAATVTRNTVIGIGVALVVMLGLMAWLVTQMVVRPVRLAARTAQRLSAGLLDQRMEVHGEDDLALLGAAFNQMAVNLQRQIVRLEEMSRLQRRFTSDVSHELRTPLTTVRMAADLFYTSRDELDPMMGRTAELLHTELDRFDELMTDLLEISRYDAGFAVLDAEPTDLVPAVHRVVRGLSAVAEQVGVTVDVHVPDVPAIAEVDPRRAERILRNLVGNAIEHSEGRPVEVTLAVDERAVAVTVRDHGIGLRPGEEKLVFNRFWRADPSRARQTGGSGLGLSISLEDARLHGGWLEAWGAPGQGAQFRLTLPARAGSKLTESPLPLVPGDADVAAVAHHYDIVLHIPLDGPVDVAVDPVVDSGADQSEFDVKGDGRTAVVGTADLIAAVDADCAGAAGPNGGAPDTAATGHSATGTAHDGAPIAAMNGAHPHARAHPAGAATPRGVDGPASERSGDD